MFKKVGESQKGGLYLHDSSYGELGVLVAVEKKVTDAIWFASKEEAIKVLTKLLEEVRKYDVDEENRRLTKT